MNLRAWARDDAALDALSPVFPRVTLCAIVLLHLAAFDATAQSPADATSAQSEATTAREIPSGASALSAAWQPAQPPPPPAHTGLKALVFETASDFNAFPRRRSTWVILGIGALAAAASHPADDNVNEQLIGSSGVRHFFVPGKYIGSVYAQAGAATGMYVIGRYVLPHTGDQPRTNKVSHLGFDVMRALIVSQTLTQGMKVAVRRDRPTGECCAFPSGHASATFATAAVLERHLGYRNAWPTFVVATYVATSRLHDNRHFLSDVVFGSALGMATGWTVVGRHGRSNYAIMPVPVKGGMMVNVTLGGLSHSTN
jgi:membrane-associated phospholipid phosphatase